MKKALFLVDPQCDFINGSLPVPGAEAAMDALAARLAGEPEEYGLKIVTCDHHPHDHCSFTANGGPWPPHCRQQSVGAAIWPALLDPLYSGGETLVLHKGQNSRREEYSIFNSHAERLISLLAGQDTVDICGLAGDICVLNTLRDAIAVTGPEKFRVLARFSPSLDGGTALAAFCRENGVAYVEDHSSKA